MLIQEMREPDKQADGGQRDHQIAHADCDVRIEKQHCCNRGQRTPVAKNEGHSAEGVAQRDAVQHAQE